jgi:hypothetical protein
MTSTIDADHNLNFQTRADCFDKSMAQYMSSLPYIQYISGTGDIEAMTSIDDTTKMVLLKRIAAFIEKISSKPTIAIELNTLTIENKKENELDNIVSEACYDFCNSHGLIGTLRQCVNKAKSSFSGIENLFADYDNFDDDENHDLGHIVLRFTVKSEQEKFLEEYNEWFDWIVTNIPPDRSQFITISPERR